MRSQGDIYSEKYEANPISEGYHSIDRDDINWEDLKEIIKEGTSKVFSERLRYVTDAGFPFWDLSYWHVRIDGVRYNVLGAPLWQVPKKNFKKQIYTLINNENVFIPKLFDSISTLR